MTTKAGPLPKVNISSDEVSNLCDRPVMDSEMKWDNEVLPEPSDPRFGPCIKRMVYEALERDEDTLVDDEYPEIIKCIVKNVWMLRRAWYEHDTRLEEQQTVCTTPGCQCDRRYDLMFRKLVYGMDTDDSESENITHWNKRSYGMSNTNNYSEGMAPRTYTPPPPPPPKEETMPEVYKSEKTIFVTLVMKKVGPIGGKDRYNQLCIMTMWIRLHSVTGKIRLARVS